MGKKLEIALAWTLLVGSLIGWPLSMFTLAKEEPPFVLSLSWLAITLTAMDLLKNSRIHKDEEDKEP